MEPTTRELKIMLDGFITRSDEKHEQFTEQLDRIEQLAVDTNEKATKTNGRVNRHDWQIKAAWWGLGIIVSIGTVGVPFLWKVFRIWMENRGIQYQAKVEKQINDSITAALSQYNIIVK